MKPILTLFCSLLLACPGFAKDKQPNVLFIAVDDLNDWVGCLGGHPQAKTPNIDRLASMGVLFEQAYCSAPLCNPSRMATMTGLRSSTIGIWSNEGRYGQTGTYSWFRDKPEFKDWVTIPQYFRQHGYTAVTGGKIFHKSQGKFSDPVSWDNQYSTKHGTPFPRNGRLLHGMSDKMAHEYYQDWADWQPLDIPETETADWKTAEGAAAFLQRDHPSTGSGQAKPFFLACGIFRPHLRWYAPQKYFDMHPLDKIELPVTLENDLDDVPPSGRRQNSGGSQAFGVIKEHGEWKKAVQGYLASCSFADACVGVVLDALEESEHAENTIVVLCGDHGYHVGEKNRISKLTLWEQGSKTPLIISTPDLAATGGKRCQQPVSLVDLYPTLVELCGLPERDGLDGRSLAPLLRKPETEWEYPAVISLRDDHAVRSQRWHYIRYADGGEELYDNVGDPHQWKNLANDTQFADAKTQLRKWLPTNKAATSRGNATRSGTHQKIRPSQEPKVSAPSTADTSRKRPNVVVLLADDLGSKDLGCYGGPVKTPVLDSLAARGVKFTDFHAGAAVCSPSRATLLTGRQNLRTGIYGVLQDHMHDMHLLEREVTIAEVLQEAGYGTAHFGKWHIGMTSGKRVKPSLTEHGFDYWFGLSNGAQPSHRNPTNFMRNGERVGPMEGYSCQIVVDDAIQWLETKPDSDQPFFMNIWFNEPHHKLAAPDEIVSIYGDLKDEGALYSATVDNTDRAIGRLVAKLKETGQLDNALIIYSSDHGSYRSDRNGGLTGAKGSYFQGGLRSPGIFFWPDGIRGGRIENTPSGAVDLLPTICGLAGIDKPKGVHLDGADLTPLLVEKGTFERPQPMFWLSPSSGHLATLREGKYTLMGYSGYKLPSDQARKNELTRQMASLAGIDPSTPRLDSRVSNTTFTSPEYKRLKGEFVRLRTFQEAWIPAIKAGGFSRFALYDLENDPQQKKDISKQRPEVTNRLKKKLLELYKDVLEDAPDWPLPKENVQNEATLPRQSVEGLVEASCIDCHDADTKTALNFDELSFDLADADAFRMWEKVYDMIDSGEMPPEKKPRPDPKLKNDALQSLHRHLRHTSLAQQKQDGRTPARRLTRTEYKHTLHDLLGIGGDLAAKLPPENLSAPFDTIAAEQGISPVHIRSYLLAADTAIDEALELGRKPNMEPRHIDYRNNRYAKMWFDRDLRRGGNTVLRTDDAYVLFDNRPQRSPHTNQTNHMGIHFPVAGQYRIVADAYAYQAKTPVTFCIYRASDQTGNKEMIGSWQLDPGQPRQVEVEHYFRPGDFFFLAPSDLDATPQGRDVFAIGAKNYPGEGVAVRHLTLEGPLEKQWPPERTRDLLGDVEFQAGRDGKYAIILRDEPLARISDVVSRLGSQALRRPLGDGEPADWASLAKPVLAEGRGFEEALRVVLRAMFSSPEFLYHQAEPGPLNDYALATRLSYFLWKSLPDDQLFLLAAEGALSDPSVLASEVDRMLDDEKSQRFVEDFLDQWLELEDIDATTPDEKLYPEYGDVLRQAMLEEPRRFFSELIWDDRGVREFIDSDFTFLNRRLAEHYDIPGVEGLGFRKVTLPAESPRGGLLTQASLLKITANGTNTSPVPRGNFILSQLLGTPPSSPPPGAGSVEPDTRGTTTIREELDAHRNVASCNRCHREIDPPGFALESFDPIGGFRTRYRSTDQGDRPKELLFGRPIREYRLGQPVDTSGVTPDGTSFDGIEDYKQWLMQQQDQIARHLLSQLIAYATGAEIQFADRPELDAMLKESREDGHGIRSLIHAVVQSDMFRRK